jgi:hypothetical protein
MTVTRAALDYPCLWVLRFNHSHEILIPIH